MLYYNIIYVLINIIIRFTTIVFLLDVCSSDYIYIYLTYYASYSRVSYLCVRSRENALFYFIDTT